MIKVAPLVRVLGDTARVIHTGQHYDNNLSDQFLSDQFLAELCLGQPKFRLDVGGQSRGSQIGDATSQLECHFKEHPPACVIVHGDTNATVAGALAANALSIPLIHVESGLRSFDRAMPEEHIGRRRRRCSR